MIVKGLWKTKNKDCCGVTQVEVKEIFGDNDDAIMERARLKIKHKVSREFDIPVDTLTVSKMEIL